MAEDRCPICLGSIEPIAMPEVCLHRFCLPCLVEWTKVTPRCPLCARLYSALLYDIDPIAKRFKKVSVCSDFSLVASDLLKGTHSQEQVGNLRGVEASSSSSSREKAVRKRSHLYALGLLPVSNFRLNDINISKKGKAKTPSQSKGSFLGSDWLEVGSPSTSQRKIEALVSKVKIFCDRDLRALIDPIGVSKEKYREEIELVTLVAVNLVERFGDLTLGSTKPIAVKELKGFLFEHTERFLEELTLFLRSPFATLEAFDHKVVYTKDGLIPIPDSPKHNPSSVPTFPDPLNWTEVIEIDEEDFTSYLSENQKKEPASDEDAFLRSDYIVIDDDGDDELTLRARGRATSSLPTSSRILLKPSTKSNPQETKGTMKRERDASLKPKHESPGKKAKYSQ